MRSDDSKKIDFVQKNVIAWGRDHFQSYPWRHSEDAWLTLLAELLLQRTRAGQVVPIFEYFSKNYPTAEDLLKNEEALDIATRHTGLHFRKTFLKDIARVVVENGGEPPEDFAALIEIRGIGPYTAGAWLSLHRDKRSVIIDSNVVRWLSRMTGERYNRDPRGLKWVQKLCEALTPPKNFKAYNYAVLDFTMLICKPKNPSCEICPVHGMCLHGKENEPRFQPEDEAS